MKRISFLLIVILFCFNLKAQNVTDALRYGVESTNGTARFNAMSGAFGALGGDLSAMGINPAGGAVFIDNFISLSASVIDTENKSEYFNGRTNSIDTDLNFNQLGGVFINYNEDPDSPWKKFSFGLNFDNVRNLDNEVFIKGTGNNSIADFFVDQANGIQLSELNAGDYSFLGERFGSFAQNAYLGYLGFVIDPVDAEDPSNTQYISNIAGNSFNQEFSSVSRGLNGKYTLNFATQYTDNLYLGVNLNIHSIDYERSNFLYESNDNVGSLVDRIGFQNNLFVYGSGFSTQVGAIYKVNNIRLGLTYDTPTWFTISEETTQSLQARRFEDGQNITENISPNIINIFPEYQLRTPGKISASGALVFGDKGLLSFDYSYKNYGNTQYGPKNDPLFIVLNNDIENSLKGASTYRLGGEYRINNVSLRGGYRFEESPYQDNTTVDDLTGFSLGLGYNYRSYNFDVSYSRAEQSRKQQIPGLLNNSVANIDSVFNNVVFTFGINL